MSPGNTTAAGDLLILAGSTIVFWGPQCALIIFLVWLARRPDPDYRLRRTVLPDRLESPGVPEDSRDEADQPATDTEADSTSPPDRDRGF